MKIIISTKYIYSWVEFEHGVITKAGEAWHNWPGRSLVALLTLLEDKKCPIRIITSMRTMGVKEFYQQFSEEFIAKEA